MEERLEEIKNQVANFKRKITNFSTFIEKYNAERDFPILEKRKSDIEKYFLTFEKWQSDLELLVKDSNHVNTRTEYKEKYYAATSKALSYLNVPSISNASQPQSSNIESIESRNSLTSNQISKTNLPRLNLPEFNGSYDTWLGFHDLFKSLVDDDKNLSDIVKLYYLKGYLKDEAAQVLTSIELSAENYKVA